MEITQREAHGQRLEKVGLFMAGAAIFIDAGSILKLASGPVQSIAGLMLLTVLVLSRVYLPGIIMRSKALRMHASAGVVSVTLVLSLAVTMALLASAIADTLKERAADMRAQGANAVFARQNLETAQARLNELLAQAGDVTALAGSGAMLRSLDSSIQRARAGFDEEMHALLASEARNASGANTGVKVGDFMASNCALISNQYKGLHAIYAGQCRAILDNRRAATAQIDADKNQATANAQLYGEIEAARAQLAEAQRAVLAVGSQAVEGDGYPSFTKFFMPVLAWPWLGIEPTHENAAVLFAWVVAFIFAMTAWAFAHGAAIHNQPTPRTMPAARGFSAVIADRLRNSETRPQPAQAAGIGFVLGDSPAQGGGNRQAAYNRARAAGKNCSQAAAEAGIPPGSASRHEARYRDVNK